MKGGKCVVQNHEVRMVVAANWRDEIKQKAEEPEGGEGYGRLSADEHLQAWHYQLQIPVILSH